MKTKNLIKKIECMVLILLIFCISHLLAEPCGDVNSDGAIDIVDALLIAQHYVGLDLSNFDSAAADVNDDGSIDIVDALLVAQYYVGLIPELPGCGETPVPTAAPTVDPTLPVGPEGYIYCADEGDSVTFEVEVHVAYGADGNFNFLYNVIGTITFDNDTFGDPIYGTVKHGFYQEAGTPTPTPTPTPVPTATPEGWTPPPHDIRGELRQWHNVYLTFDGPDTSETADPNPFLYYRMDVTFRNGNQEIVVPGYYAADGDAAETGATSGNKWRVHLCPNAVGEWTYTVSFREGTDVSISDNPLAGNPVSPDGATGSFTILPTDKTGRDHRYHGMLEYADNHYYRYAGSGEYFIQVGTQSPENFIGYGEFDNTYDIGGGGGDMVDGVHWYENHKQHWKQGDPTWKDGKGKGIIGALNYLAGLGMNAYYIITMNITGDCRETWPFISHESDDYFTYDVSKLDQWDIVFSHGNTLGMLVLVNVEEEESERLLGKMTDPKRKLYYRELIARFAHNQAIQWNLSEEADKHGWNTAQDLKDHCNYIRNLDPYDHPIGWVQYKGEYMDDDETYGMMYGFPHFEACGLQNDPDNTSFYTKKWVDNSANHGRKWIVPILEANLGNNGVPPDSNDYWHDNIREECIWPNLMAGGAGCGFYYGENFPNSDNDCEDFTPREHLFVLEDIARQFFIRHVPFWDGMHHDDDLVSGSDNHVYAKPNEVYAIYLKNGGSPTLNLSGASGTFMVQWYDPRYGGELQNGSITEVTGGGQRSLGNPPNESSSDWAVLVRRDICTETEPVSGVTLSPTSKLLGLGGTTLLSASVEPFCAGNKNVSWSSSNTSVAAVDSTGLVTGVSEGTATITVTTDEGGFTDTCEITVDNIVSITIQENETGVVSFDGIITTEHSGYTGSGSIDTDNATGNGITWEICVPSNGTYTLQWRYSNGDSNDRPGQLLVDGAVVVSNISLPSTGGWASWTMSSTVDVSLTAGTRLIRLEGTTSSALGLTDYITITGDNPQPGGCTM